MGSPKEVPELDRCEWLACVLVSNPVTKGRKPSNYPLATPLPPLHISPYTSGSCTLAAVCYPAHRVRLSFTCFDGRARRTLPMLAMLQSLAGQLPAIKATRPRTKRLARPKNGTTVPLQPLRRLRRLIKLMTQPTPPLVTPKTKKC